jgi:hypothetical protein
MLMFAAGFVAGGIVVGGGIWLYEWYWRIMEEAGYRS